MVYLNIYKCHTPSIIMHSIETIKKVNAAYEEKLLALKKAKGL